MTQEHPVVDRYINALKDAIKACTPSDQQEIVQEIRNHIAEATAAGKPLPAVLESLGSADTLARAYVVELVLHPTAKRPLDSLTQFVTTAALVAVGSLTTLVVVTALGSIGATFVVAGLVTLIIGLLEATGLHLAGVQTGGIAPVWIILMGPVGIALGLGSLLGLRRYVRFLVRTLRAGLPGRRAVA